MSIEKQIEALTQELRPCPNDSQIFCFDSRIGVYTPEGLENGWRVHWDKCLFASTSKAEVEEYADCYRRLKLYQLLGKKAEKEYLLIIGSNFYGTDFMSLSTTVRPYGQVKHTGKPCVLGGVWFSREEDRLEALKICNITKEFQEKCSKYGLGGA